MKMHLIALAGLTITFALPTFAQKQNAVDPEVRQQILNIAMKRLDAFNKQDASAYIAVFTQDAVLVSATESGDVLCSGQDAIKKSVEVELASGFRPWRSESWDVSGRQ